MKHGTGMEGLLCRDLARLVAAGLQLPGFVVLSEASDGTPRWLDTSVLAVARHWQIAFSRAALLPETVDLVVRLATAVNRVLDGFLGLYAGVVSTWRVRRQMTRELQRQVIIDWLRRTRPQEPNAATRAWQRQRDVSKRRTEDATIVWQTWDPIHSEPELATLRASLTRHVEQPPVPRYRLHGRICGLRTVDR
jgi:hypothetical protein